MACPIGHLRLSTYFDCRAFPYHSKCLRIAQSNKRANGPACNMCVSRFFVAVQLSPSEIVHGCYRHPLALPSNASMIVKQPTQTKNGKTIKAAHCRSISYQRYLRRIDVPQRKLYGKNASKALDGTANTFFRWLRKSRQQHTRAHIPMDINI